MARNLYLIHRRLSLFSVWLSIRLTSCNFTPAIYSCILSPPLIHCVNSSKQLKQSDCEPTSTPGRYTACANMNFLCQGVRKLSCDRHTDRQTTYAWSLPVMWQRWRSHHSIARSSQKPHATCKPIFCRTGVMGDRSLHCGNGHFWGFWLLWPWPWPDDLCMRTWPVLLY